MADLDGEWDVVRTGGLLPPLPGVRKRIRGAEGATAIGRLPGFGFDVVGLELRYRPPLRGLVDHLEPDGAGFRGVARIGGREWGRFRLERR